jgi:uncharacterized protein (DUF2164 family)
MFTPFRSSSWTPSDRCWGRFRIGTVIPIVTFTAVSHMPITLTPAETQEAIHSLKKYCASELDHEIGDLPAKLLLNYILQEIAPLAYNQGVKHADEFLRGRLEDLPATVFEPGLTYWKRKR